MATKRVTKKAAPKAAAKVEVTNFRDYEMVYVVRPDISDDNLDPIVEKTSQLITSRGGTISGIERWGKRKLAYPIKHFTEGHYVLARFKLSPAGNKELEANLQITEEIIRFLIVVKD
ncbi:MAG: 30S ribosomal protein S6 [Dehalococcoidales bacterium]|nr:30S ribosomal protein S6 [Dehalococcoidales bacterium]